MFKTVRERMKGLFLLLKVPDKPDLKNSVPGMEFCAAARLH